MPFMKDKTRDDKIELEFAQGQHLDKDPEFSFFDVELGKGNKRSAGTYHDDDVEIEFATAVYHEPDPDFSKLSDTLPNFEQDLERLELERDKLKDRYTHAWTQGDIVSHLALEAKYHELNGFIKGLNVLKDVLRHWEEYAWGEMNIGDYYNHGDILDPQHRQAAQRTFDTLTARALQILSRHQERKEDPS